MFENNRILVVDDNELIHEDFRKILLNTESIQEQNEYINLEKELFGSTNSSTLITPEINYEIDFAFQGQDAFEMVKKAENIGKPYALIFMDVRMPPGWDGIETIAKIWDHFPNIEIVICSAYSDYSWDKIVSKLGSNDRLIFLKKPFDSIEVKQLALALIKKWNLYEKSKNYVYDLEKDVSKRTKQLKSMLQELVENRDKLKQEIFIRKLTEQELASEKENLSSILKNVPDAVISIDNNGKINFINKTTENLLGRDNQALIYQNINDVLKVYDKNNQPVTMFSSDNILKYSGTDCDNRILEIKVSEQLIKSIILSYSHIYDKDGKINGLVILIKDISEKLKLEEELIKAKKLDSVSTFAGGIAQDFEKIITGIIGNISLAKQTLTDNDSAIQYLVEAEDQSIRAGKLSEQLKTFSKDSKNDLNNNARFTNYDKKILILSTELSISNLLSRIFEKFHYTYYTAIDLLNESDILCIDESYFQDNLTSDSLIDSYNGKIVVFSSLNTAKTKEKYSHSKLINFIEKPFKITDIENILNSLI